MLSAPIARIILRYGAGYLVLHGLISAGDGHMLATDTDLIGVVETVIGVIAMAATELWYWAAKRFGWSV